MKKFIPNIWILVLLFCIESQYLNAQMNVNISFNYQQNKSITEKKTFDDSLKLHSYINQQINLLHINGYETAYHFFSPSINDTLQLFFVSGESFSFYIKNIEYSDSTSLPIPKDIYKKIISNKSSFLNLESLLLSAIAFYENNGYPFASCQLSRIEFDKDTINATIFVQTNKKYLFDSIVIKGEAKISDSFVRQFFNIKKNDAYSEKKLKQIISKSKQIPFLTIVRPPEVNFTEDQCQTYFFINKRKSHSFDGIIGFLPPNEGSKNIQLTGDIKLKLSNLFAQGEQLSFDWRAYEANSQDMNINFSYPFILATPFGTEILFKLNKKDSSYINQKYQLGINYFFSGFDYIKGFYESSVSNTFSSDALSNLKIRSSKTSNYGLEFFLNRLNDPVLATQGYLIKTSVAAGTVKRAASQGVQTLEESNETQYNLKLKIPVYIPVYKRFILFTELQSNYLNSNTLYDNEMFQFGGNKTLKGFDEDVLIASFYSTLTTEIRYMLETYSYFSLFWNGAYYEKKAISETIYDTPWGIGVGIAFNTPAGIFTLNYAVGKQFNNPLDLRSSKIHFGITGNF